jgi:hypothetical protein
MTATMTANEPTRRLPAPKRRRLAAEECREACRAWRRLEIGDHELQQRVAEICKRYGVKSR